MKILQDHDAIIIGGGHNGLVCACYLAAKGLLRVEGVGKATRYAVAIDSWVQPAN